MAKVATLPTKKLHGPLKPIPGYHFKPTDEILIVHYLRKKLQNQHVPGNLMPEVDVYEYAPEDLIRMYKNWEQDGFWYFFTPRGRKYPKGKLPSRKIKGSSGGWIATGSDIVINSHCNKQELGNRKTLVYHKEGKVKTNWIMYEYLDASQLNQEISHDHDGNMKLDGVVLCSIHATGKKNNGTRELRQLQGQVIRTDSVASDITEVANTSTRALTMSNFPNSDTSVHRQNMECAIDQNQAVGNPVLLLTYSKGDNTDAAVAEFENGQNAWNQTGASINPGNGLQYGTENMACEIGQDQAVGNPAMVYNYSEGGNNTEAAAEFENVQNSWNSIGASISPEDGLQFGMDQAIGNPAMLYYSEGGNTEAAAGAAAFESAQNAFNVTNASISQEHNFQPGPVGGGFSPEMGELPVIHDDGFDVSEYLDLDSK